MGGDYDRFCKELAIIILSIALIFSISTSCIVYLFFGWTGVIVYIIGFFLVGIIVALFEKKPYESVVYAKPPKKVYHKVDMEKVKLKEEKLRKELNESYSPVLKYQCTLQKTIKLLDDKIVDSEFYSNYSLWFSFRLLDENAFLGEITKQALKLEKALVEEDDSPSS